MGSECLHISTRYLIMLSIWLILSCSIPAKRVIIRQGQKAEIFYFLITGSGKNCSLFIRLAKVIWSNQRGTWFVCKSSSNLMVIINNNSGFIYTAQPRPDSCPTPLPHLPSWIKVTLKYLISPAAVTRSEADHITKEPCTKVIQILRKGECFGEPELLHNIKRTSTITAEVPCELIAIEMEVGWLLDLVNTLWGTPRGESHCWQKRSETGIRL